MCSIVSSRKGLHPRLLLLLAPAISTTVEMQAVIVAPSRELAMQIFRVGQSLLPHEARGCIQQCIGGANPYRQVQKHLPKTCLSCRCLRMRMYNNWDKLARWTVLQHGCTTLIRHCYLCLQTYSSLLLCHLNTFMSTVIRSCS